MRRGSEHWELMRIVFSVILSMVKSFIGGTLAFDGFMLKLGGSFRIFQGTILNGVLLNIFQISPRVVGRR